MKIDVCMFSFIHVRTRDQCYGVEDLQYVSCMYCIQIVGDKHGPDTTQFLGHSDHNLTVSEIGEHLNVTVRFVHVIRDPLDNVATMALRENKNRKFIQQVGS